MQTISRCLGRRRERGFAVVFYGVMLTFVVACVGLAIDVGSLFMIRSRLVAAVDAAALGAGRSINGTSTPTAAQAAANAAALQFFAANFSTGYFNTLSAPTVTPTFTASSTGSSAGTLQIQVTASVPAPTYFMNIFNVRSVTVSATGTATRRNLVLMLVLDQSSSMGSASTAGSPCAVMIAAANNFVSEFSPYDYVGLITFDSTAYLMDSPTTSRSQIATDIGNIQCNNNTNTISALELAYQQIQATNLPLALNTIVLFTDGSPNGVTATFPVRTTLDTRWGPSLCPPGSGCSPAGPASPYPQTGTTMGTYIKYQSPSGAINNSCVSGGDSTAVTDANGTSSNAPCVNMALVCTTSTDTFYGTITQWGGQNSYGAATWGIANPTSGSTSGTAPDNLSLPPSSHCNLGGAVVGSAGTNIRQYVAYIPNTDIYGNSLLGVVATSNTGTAANGYVSRTGQWNAIGLVSQNDWLFQVNNVCSPDSITPQCRNTGDVWSNYSTTGTASNFFPKGTAYVGHLRPDQPNTIVAASMNGAMAEANRIRSDTTYNIMIDTMYLTGNATDSVDREFLPIIANTPQITRLPYDPHNFTPYANPAYHSNQQIGTYAVTADKNELASIMNQIASQVLRLSH